MDHNRVETFLAKAEITELVNRCFAALDQKEFDATTMRLIFADDARIVRPNGAETIGPQAIGESFKNSFVRFRATQHQASGVVVTLHDHGQAAFRGNLVAMPLWAEGLGEPTVDPTDNYFLALGVASGNAAMTPEGWRITRLTNDVLWRKGTGFNQILQTQQHQRRVNRWLCRTHGTHWRNHATAHHRSGATTHRNIVAAAGTGTAPRRPLPPHERHPRSPL